ncbi:MAG: polyprenyl diphosphate synthase [Patescibacteria group bacterium]|nr:polyprenyl diphosphate synthase [Patescibacteria group bacterium]
MKKTPHHIAILPDGNRRWAREKGLPISEGHKKGLETIKKAAHWCRGKGVKILTFFVFSTENWNRPKKEIDYFMSFIKQALTIDLKEFADYGIRLKLIGTKERLPKSIIKAGDRAEKATKNNKKMTINLGLSYGGKAEITEAVKNIVKSGASTKEINEELISDNLWTPDLDLVIRTGGEHRISNFLIWQAAYSELFFLKKYWPDFSERDLDKILLDYSGRERRFGR